MWVLLPTAPAITHLWALERCLCAGGGRTKTQNLPFGIGGRSLRWAKSLQHDMKAKKHLRTPQCFSVMRWQVTLHTFEDTQDAVKMWSSTRHQCGTAILFPS